MSRRRSKNPKTAQIQRLRDKADKIWSQIIRTNYPKCVMCGATENLQAHHCIVTKGASNSTRWDTRNGITLCYNCHINKYHGQTGNCDFHRILVHKIDSYLSYSEQTKIIQKSKQIFKMNKGNLELKIEELQNHLDSLQDYIYKYEPLDVDNQIKQ